jgi:hypothetical protein
MQPQALFAQGKHLADGKISEGPDTHAKQDGKAVLLREEGNAGEFLSRWQCVAAVGETILHVSKHLHRRAQED